MVTKWFKTCILASFISLYGCVTAYSEIKVDCPKQIKVYEPLVVKVDTQGVCLWRTAPDVKYISLDNSKTLHIWTSPGKHNLELTVIVIDWDKKTFSAEQTLVEFEVISLNPPEPPIPPQPPQPVGKLSYLLLLEESSQRTVEMGRLLNNKILLDWQKSTGLHLDVVDLDVATPTMQAYLKLSNTRPLLILDSDKDASNGVLYADSLPTDASQLVALFNKYRGQ